MIQFLSVTKSYPASDDNIVAVEDVSFDVDEGEFVFLVGPSGSGKTTLIKMLIREINPTEGKIFFNDEDITRFKRQQIYRHRRKIGVIFQDFKLIPELNAYENVAFAMEVAGRSPTEIKEHVPYLLDIVGLGHRMHFFPKQLSGGEKQRVAIARAISNNPDLLIADEPTGNLDPESAWDIVQILSKINNWGTTVLMSTHGFDIVNSLHKRVIKMEDGKMVRDVMKGTYEELDDFSLKVMNVASEKADSEDPKTGDKKEEKKKTKSEKSALKRKSKKKSDPSESEEAMEETETEGEEEDTKTGEDEEIETTGDAEPIDAEEVVEEEDIEKTTKKEKKKAKDKDQSQDVSNTDEEEAELEAEEDNELETKILEKIDSDEPIKIELKSEIKTHKQDEPKGNKTEAKMKKADVEKMEEELDEEKVLKKASKTKISKLDLSRKELGALKEGGYSTVGDLIEAGVDKLKKIDSLTKTNIKNISKEIEKFASKS